MAGVELLQTAEATMRRLLDEEGLPQPDEVDYLETKIALLWHEQKLSVIVDVSPLPH